MLVTRIFKGALFMQPVDEGERVRSVITQSAEATVVAWYVKPGQGIAAHVHPNGQDTWTVLSGHGQYQLDADGTAQAIFPGDVVVAPTGLVHGVVNNGEEPLVFISVISPAEAGYLRLETPDDGYLLTIKTGRSSAQGVRREKAALSSGCKAHPATAPAGSNRSSYGGNEIAEAFG